VSETPRTDELRDKLARLGWNPHKDKPVADLFVEIEKLERELAEVLAKLMRADGRATHWEAQCKASWLECDTLAKALSMYGLPYTDDDLEHIAQNPSPHSEIGMHEAKRELIRRKALAAVKGEPK